jgi:exonuclease III
MVHAAKVGTAPSHSRTNRVAPSSPALQLQSYLSQQLPHRKSMSTKRHFNSKPRGKRASLIPALLSTPQSMRFAWINANSVVNKLGPVTDFLDHGDILVACISETKALNQNLDSKTHRFVSAVNGTRAGKSLSGGLGFFVRNDCDAVLVAARADCAWLRIGDCFVGSVYRPPSQADAASFFDALSADIARYQRVIVGGDFNVHICANGDTVLDNNGKKLLAFCESNKLLILNLLPCTTGSFSRVQHKQWPNGAVTVEQSTIDYVLIPAAMLSLVSHLLLDAVHQFSDHKPLVLTTMPLTNKLVAKTVDEYFTWRQTVLTGECKTAFAAELDCEMTIWQEEIADEDALLTRAQILSPERASQVLDSWYLHYYAACNKTVKRKLVKRGGNPSRSWFSPDLRQKHAKLTSLRASLSSRTLANNAVNSSLSAGGNFACNNSTSAVLNSSLSAGGNFACNNSTCRQVGTLHAITPLLLCSTQACRQVGTLHAITPLLLCSTQVLRTTTTWCVRMGRLTRKTRF